MLNKWKIVRVICLIALASTLSCAARNGNIAVQFDIGEPSTAVSQVSMISPENLYAWNSASLLDDQTLLFSAKQWVGLQLTDTISIWRLRTNGGAATKLVPAGSGEALFNAAAHPRSERLAFVLNNCAIYMANKSGVGGRTKLPSTGYCDYFPQPVPGKTKLVFSSCTWGRDCYFQDSNYIWTMDQDGTDMVQLRQGREPSVSPDGKRITFSYGADIWVMNVDGTDVTNLTPGDSHYDVGPVFSPDGKNIAFVRQVKNTSGAWGNQDIWAMRADGSTVTQLTMNPAADMAPNWGQDGYIYFISNRGALVNGHLYNNRIWRMRPAAI
jgi:hypothetical protein